jgi:hypothetical protein
MGNQDTLLDNIIQLKIQLREMFFQHYFASELFKWVWWFEITVIIASFVIWWKFVDKKRLLGICVFGLLANVFATFLDVLGSDFVFWEYRVHMLPQLPLLIPIDYVIVPVIDMILYQKFPKWGKYIFASTIAAAVLAFVCEPLAVRIGMYRPITWRFVYSFPIYILINIIAKFCTDWFISKQTAAIKNN